jgi:hypothetical protein
MKTTRAIREYLERHGLIPCGDAKKDMAAAKKLKPDYQEYLREQSNEKT